MLFEICPGSLQIVTLLLECGVEVNTRNYCGQTALMQACRYGHWEVVQTLLLYRANVNRADYLNGRTALHFAAVSGHSRSLARVVNRAADGGITSLHMAALNCHTECLQLLLDLSANVNAVTIQDGTTIDLIGAGSAPLHYAACGGSIPCCQALIAKGASRIATNCNGWTPLQVARLLRRHWLEPLLIPDSSIPVQPLPPSRYLALPLSSIMKIARDCGWRIVDPAPVDADPCSVCLERRCTVAAEGCGHELCTRCALYLCSTNIIATATSSPPGAIPCPLCRHGIVSFVKLPTTMSLKDLAKMNLASLTLCTTCTMEIPELNSARALLHKGENRGGCRVSPLSIHSLRLTCPGFSSLNCPGGFGSNDENSGCTSPAVTCGFARSDSRSEVRTDDPTTIETLAWPLPSRVSILRTTPVVAANTLPVQPPNNDGVPSTSKPAPQRDYSSPKVTTRRWLREPFRWSNYASLRSQRN
uniref:RING-type E3 ubiquitin transferase n=1 Tax=Physcomitrium patens TaxID=3218 RepID=A0A7I4DK24_PHYPA